MFYLLVLFFNKAKFNIKTVHLKHIRKFSGIGIVKYILI